MSHPEPEIAIYLDNAATSFPKPEAVYQAWTATPGPPWATPAVPDTAWPPAANGSWTIPAGPSIPSSTAKTRSAGSSP